MSWQDVYYTLIKMADKITKIDENTAEIEHTIKEKVFKSELLREISKTGKDCRD